MFTPTECSEEPPALNLSLSDRLATRFGAQKGRGGRGRQVPVLLRKEKQPLEGLELSSSSLASMAHSELH